MSQTLEQESANNLNLKDLTIEQIRAVQNPVLRDTLLQSKEQLAKELSSSYVSHNQHESHSNTV